MKFRNLVVAIAGLVFFALASFAQVAGVEGIVKGADGKPVQGAIVKIDRTDMKGHWECKPTDKKGHYIYNGLPIAANYKVSLFVEGKEVDSVNGIHPSPGEMKDVPFDLKAAKVDNAAQQAMAQKAMETGQISDELARSMTAEQKASLQKQIDAGLADRKKKSALNSSFNDGMTALQNKEYEKAIEQFNKAGELDPSQIAVWNNLADAYMKLADTKTGPEHDAAVQKSLETYQKSIALKPEDANVRNNYGVALARAGKYPEMRVEFQKSVELDPTKACQAYFNLGAILTNAGQTDEALGAFKKATELDDKCADAFYQTGVTLIAKATVAPDGKMVPAPGTVEAINKYLELQPSGKYAADAKSLLTQLGSTVDNSYKDPNAKTTQKKKK